MLCVGLCLSVRQQAYLKNEISKIHHSMHADPPRCDGNLTRRAGPDDPATIECTVTFLGQHNLTLEWLAPNGTVIGQEEFSSGELPSVARLRVGAEVPTPGRLDGSTEGGYQCRAYFSNGTAQFPDQASNAPELRRDTCTVPLPSPAASPVDTSTSAQQPAWSTVHIALLVAGCVLGLFVIVAIALVVRKRRNRNTGTDGRHHDATDPCLSSREDGIPPAQASDEATSFMPQTQNYSVQQPPDPSVPVTDLPDAGSQQRSIVNSPDSARAADIDLHADESLVVQPNDETRH